MKLTHPCKDTCSGYSQDCAEQIAALQARVEELESDVEVFGRFAEQFGDLSNCYDAVDVTAIVYNKFRELREDNAKLRKVVDAARDYLKVTSGMTAEKDIPLIEALRELDGEKTKVELKCPMHGIPGCACG